jgi:hypothetical protein
MKPKPAPVKHWYKAIITTVPTGLHKAQSPTNLEAKYITTNKQNQRYESRFTGTEWYQCTKIDIRGKPIDLPTNNQIR